MKDKIKHFASVLGRYSLIRNICCKLFWVKLGVIDKFIILLKTKKISNYKIKNNTGHKKILFLRMRFMPRALTTELVLAKGLNEKNVECKFIFCDSNLPICNGWSILNDNPHKLCRYCLTNNKEVKNLLPFDSIFLDNTISNQDFQKLENKYAEIDVNNLKELTINGFDIGNELYMSLAKFLFVGKIENTSKNNEYAKKFAISGHILVHSLEKMFNSENPDIVIMNCGHIFWYGIAFQILKSKKIKTITYDEMSLAVTKLHWVFSNAEPCVDFKWDHDWERFSKRNLSKTQEKKIMTLINERKKYFLYKIDKTVISLDSIINLKPYKKVVSLFTNVLWDATILGKNDIFIDTIDWIKTTIKFFEEHDDLFLIIRIHPAEAKLFDLVSKERVLDELLAWKKEYKNNILFIESEQKINSYEIVESSDLVLTYASNIGLESVLENKNVIVSGICHYKNKGFTLDPKTKDEYLNLLKKFSTNSLIEKIDIELAMKYCYFSLIDSQIDLKIFTENHPFLVNDLNFEDFNSDNSNVISELVNWILKYNTDGFFFNSYKVEERNGI